MSHLAHRSSVLAVLVLAAGAVGARDEPGQRPGPEATAAAVESPAEASAAAGDSVTAPEGTDNPCRVHGNPGDVWLDKLRRGVFETVCGSARWFDQFFGDRRFDAEARNTHGRLRLITVHDDFRGFDANLQLRAHVNFPNLDNRVNAFLGREREEEFLRGEDNAYGEFLPDFFRDAEEQDWLLGLGYSPPGSARQKFDLDGGVNVRLPLEPFVRGRYRRHWVVGEKHLVRFRETVYWRNQRGFGTSIGIDLERVLGSTKLLRWETRGTIDESTEGVAWRSAILLFQDLGHDRALAYRLAWNGETDHEVPVGRYGPQVTYRQRLFREWFYGEIVAGVTWPKEYRYQDREASFNIGFGAEIRFEYEQ